MQSVASYLEQYKSAPKEFPLIQEKAIAHFSRLGFPTHKNEEWRYTNISPLLAKEFSFATPSAKIPKEEILNRFPFLSSSFFVVIENGKINSSASLLNNLPSGIEIKNLRGGSFKQGRAEIRIYLLFIF